MTEAATARQPVLYRGTYQPLATRTQREDVIFLPLSNDGETVNMIMILGHIDWLVQVAQRIGVPVAATEQYPQGIGHTHPLVAARLPANATGVKLHFSYEILQLGICSVIPLVVLGFVSLKSMSDTMRNRLGLICSALILIQVLAMRWNVVVGGQLFSKSLRGLTSYAPTFLGREGILVALILFSMPFVVMYIFNLILPLFETKGEEAQG